MLRVALGRVSALVSCTRSRGSSLRQLWGRGARLSTAGKRRAWGWRCASSETGPGAARYQLVYTCKVGARRGRDHTSTYGWTALQAERWSSPQEPGFLGEGQRSPSEDGVRAIT